MLSPVVIANRPFWARILAVFWVIEAGVGLAFAIAGMSWIGAGENGVAGVMIVCGLLLALVGVIMAAMCWRVARLQGPAIEMRPEGLIDRRLTEQVISWEAIAWKIIFNSRSYSLQFDVVEPQRSQLEVYWEQRVMARFNRMFRYPEFTVATQGTGKSAHALGEFMQRFRPAASH